MLTLQHIEIAACKNGQLKYSLIFAGKEIDRFIIAAKDQHPKRRAGWITHALELGNQPSAEVTIPPVDIPAIEYNTFEKLERAEAGIRALTYQGQAFSDIVEDEYKYIDLSLEKPTRINVQTVVIQGPIADVMSAVDEAFNNVKHPLP